jgi:CDP-diacylglycerol--serine O-phosphatidyltransferase
MGLYDYREALPALAMVLVPAVLMVSTIRFRSFKNFDLQSRRPYTVLIFIAAGIMLVTTHPRFVLVLLAYSYLFAGLIGFAVTRIRHKGPPPLQDHASDDAPGSASLGGRVG